MFNGVMRVVSSLLGLLMVAMGGIWILQGFGLAFTSGSFMANDKMWSLWGILLAAVGACQIVWSNRRQRF